ncbi:MAG TPA: energy transducer TonB [Methylovirgula sp.]|nr:energy transducer TonB [Methylovirgula sp.]
MIEHEPRNDMQPSWAQAVYQETEDARAWFLTVFLRWVMVPVVVTVLLSGGVFWLRQQKSTGSAQSDDISMVQVRLVAPAEPVAAPRQPTAAHPVSRIAFSAESAADQAQATASDDASVAALDQPFTPPVAEPDVGFDAPVDAPPDSVALKFRQELFRHIELYRHYPAAARRDHLHGTVETLFLMRRDGTVLDVQVKESSGQSLLDKEAVETIRRAQPLPAIPPGLPEELSIQLSIAFDPS